MSDVVKWSSITRGLAHQPIIVRPAETLMSDACTTVRIGTAPDGLPLVLTVGRPSSEDFPLVAGLHAVRSSLPETVVQALQPLESRVRLRPLEGEQVYCTEAPVLRLFGSTVLARMIGVDSPLSSEERRAASPQRARIAPSRNER